MYTLISSPKVNSTFFIYEVITDSDNNITKISK